MTGRRRIAFAAAGVVVAAAGVTGGFALATPSPTVGSADTLALTGSASGAPSWMTSSSGYSSMMGQYGISASAGHGHAMGGGMTSGGMMGGVDMGAIMGRVLDGVPGPRISAAQAEADARAVPEGAVVDRTHNRLTFATSSVALTVVAGADPAAMDRIEVAGLTDPDIVVPTGARVTLRLVNADTDMAHGIVVTSPDAAPSWMPMMSSSMAFPGSAIWALGEADSSSAPAATSSFIAGTSGIYVYLCPVPGHAQQGMGGTLTVR